MTKLKRIFFTKLKKNCDQTKKNVTRPKKKLKEEEKKCDYTKKNVNCYQTKKK